MFYRNSILTSLSIVAVSSLSACGSNQNLAIKGVDVSTSQINSDTYVNMEAIILMGSLSFPNLQVPVLNPQTLQPIGQLTLQHLNDNSNSLSVSIDYSQVAKLNPALGQTLPNGREIPILLGAQNAALAAIPILTGSKIYLGGDLNKDLFIGAAIAIPAFDSIMTKVPIPLNIFFNFPFSTEITGVGGLFSGPSAGQNGVAVFVKRSAPTTSTPTPPTALTGLRPQATAPVMSVAEQATNKNNEINKVDTVTLFRLNRLFNKHATLKIK